MVDETGGTTTSLSGPCEDDSTGNVCTRGVGSYEGFPTS